MVWSGRKRFLRFLLSPFVLAILPAIIFIYIIPVSFKKYLLEVEKTITLPDGNYLWYNDINNDGYSEEILVFDEANSAGIKVSGKNGVFDQWNIRGTFKFSAKSTIFIAADCNGDKVKEIYLFSLREDSIFLNSIPDLGKMSLGIEDRFIAVTGKGIKAPDPFIIKAEPEDLNNDGFNELIFGIVGGFSKFPRNVYAYYLNKDSLVTSPQASYFFWSIIQEDIDGDGVKEIVPGGYAPGNVSPSEAKYHDHSSWLMILDKNLKFLFEPIEFKGKYSIVQPLIHLGGNDTILSALYFSNDSGVSSKIYKFTRNGTISLLNDLKSKVQTGLITIDKKGHPIYITVDETDHLKTINNKKHTIIRTKITRSFNAFQFDIENDGKKEIIFSGFREGKFYVFREGCKNKAEIDLNVNPGNLETISIRNVSPGINYIVVQNENKVIYIRYIKNPFFILVYLLIFLIYGGFIVFVVLIEESQKRRILAQQKIEQKISELQLALLRNQLDPHFTLNALNSVIYFVNNSDKEKASEGLRRFAGLYREMVLSSGQSRRTIGEEVAFCDDYLQLEKFRFGDKFDYSIMVAENVETNILIPKLLIQLYAENAIKHGIKPLNRRGFIEISIKGTENMVEIEIEDNGVGRSNASGKDVSSTGKGLLMMEELYSIYNKYYNEKIRSEITDLYDDRNHPAGTLVRININYK